MCFGETLFSPAEEAHSGRSRTGLGAVITHSLTLPREKTTGLAEPPWTVRAVNVPNRGHSTLKNMQRFVCMLSEGTWPPQKGNIAQVLLRPTHRGAPECQLHRYQAPSALPTLPLHRNARGSIFLIR